MPHNFLENKILRNDMEEIYNLNYGWKKLYNSTILISGATGMLASYLVYFLIYLNEVHHAGIKIIALVRNEAKCRLKFGVFSDKNYFHILTADITNEISVEETVDYIVHTASLASPQYYAVNPVEVILPNSTGTWRMLELAREKKVKSFLLFSTCDIYGDLSGQDIPAITEMDMGVVDPLNIHSCYNESKRLAETLCKAYVVEYSVPAKIARIFHTYAPTMDLEKDPRVFSSFMKCAVEKRDIVMHSDGFGRRAFCYITDAVGAYLKVMLDGQNGEAYNIGNTEQFVSMFELANIICSLEQENNLKVVRRERDKSESYTENKIADKTFDNSKAKKLGCSFSVNVRDGFGRVLRYFQESNK